MISFRPTGNGNLSRPLRSAIKYTLLNRFHVSRVTFLINTEHGPVDLVREKGGMEHFHNLTISFKV